MIFKFQMDSTLESTANCHRNCVRTTHSIAEHVTAVTACAPGRGIHFEMTQLLTNFIFESSFRLNKVITDRKFNPSVGSFELSE